MYIVYIIMYIYKIQGIFANMAREYIFSSTKYRFLFFWSGSPDRMIHQVVFGRPSWIPAHALLDTLVLGDCSTDDAAVIFYWIGAESAAMDVPKRTKKNILK